MAMFATVEVNLMSVFSRASADILMFVTAALAYWILHTVKARAKILPSKVVDKEVSWYEDQESPKEKATPTIKKEEKAGPQQTCQAQVTKAAPSKIVQVPVSALTVDDLIQSLRNFAASRNIKETLKGFRSIQQRNTPMTSCIYNIVLQAWVNCGNLWAAENFLEEVKSAGMCDGKSYSILVKALVRVDVDRARTYLHELQDCGQTICSTTYDDLIFCLARSNLFDEGISLLQMMNSANVEPSQITRCAIARLINGARAIHLKVTEIHQVVAVYNFDVQGNDEVSMSHPSELPRLAAVIARAQQSTSRLCLHDVEIKGSEKAVLAAAESLKTLEKGTLYRSAEGGFDKLQSEIHRARMSAILKCVSRQSLGLPWHMEGLLLDYLGSDPYVLRLAFESNSIHAPLLDELSQCHPRVGFRHCWVKPAFGSCGQRTFSNGEDINEAAFSRHVSSIFG